MDVAWTDECLLCSYTEFDKLLMLATSAAATAGGCLWRKENLFFQVQSAAHTLGAPTVCSLPQQVFLIVLLVSTSWFCLHPFLISGFWALTPTFLLGEKHFQRHGRGKASGSELWAADTRGTHSQGWPHTPGATGQGWQSSGTSSAGSETQEEPPTCVYQRFLFKW